MSEGMILNKNDGESWYCSCGTLNLSENRRCDSCGEKNNEEEKEEGNVPSLTDNMNFRFPKRIIPY